MTERVAIFIDGSNLYHALEENCGRMDLEFQAFINTLTDGRYLHRAYYYNILQDSERRGHAFQEQGKFLATLYNTPYLEVRLGTSKYRGDMLVEKGIDIMIATDILLFAWRDLYDSAILVSGDGDFAYALQAVKNFGKHTEVVSFPGNLSYELSQTADVLTLLEKDFFKGLWVSGRNSKKTSNETNLRNNRRRRRTVTATNKQSSQQVTNGKDPSKQDTPGPIFLKEDDPLLHK